MDHFETPYMTITKKKDHTPFDLMSKKQALSLSLGVVVVGRYYPIIAQDIPTMDLIMIPIIFNLAKTTTT